MQFEGVGSISMSGIPFEVFGKIDDIDGLEGTLLDADTAPDAQWFGQVGDFGLWTDFDTELAELDYWA